MMTTMSLISVLRQDEVNKKSQITLIPAMSTSADDHEQWNFTALNPKLRYRYLLVNYEHKL
jgi:hypothetical protein